MLAGEILLFPGILGEIEELGAFFSSGMSGLVAIDFAVVGEEEFPVAFDTPAEKEGFFRIFDVGNVVRFGWPEHWIRILRHRIFKLDIKEYSRKLQNNEGLWKGFTAKLGEGSVDWSEVMKALREIDYRGGWGSAEVAGGDLDRLKDISRRMDRVFAM